MRKLILICAALLLFGAGATRYPAIAQQPVSSGQQATTNPQQSPNSLTTAWHELKLKGQSGEAIGWMLAYLGIIVVLFWAASTSDMLRDSAPESFGDIQIGPTGSTEPKRPFSLAQSQMAWWFALVLAAYVFLFLITGDIPALTAQTLILMGIGTGTALGAKNKTNAKLDRFKSLLAQIASNPVPANVANLREEARRLAADLSSKNFVNDILTDVDGISLHRFQSFIWTIALGAVFVIEVVIKRQLPQFDEYTLGILGISAGTYLGFKIPETPS